MDHNFINAALVFEPPPVVVISPVTRIDSFEESQIFHLTTFVSNLRLESILFSSPYFVLF